MLGGSDNLYYPSPPCRRVLRTRCASMLARAYVYIPPLGGEGVIKNVDSTEIELKFVADSFTPPDHVSLHDPFPMQAFAMGISEGMLSGWHRAAGRIIMVVTCSGWLPFLPSDDLFLVVFRYAMVRKDS